MTTLCIYSKREFILNGNFEQYKNILCSETTNNLPLPSGNPKFYSFQLKKNFDPCLVSNEFITTFLIKSFVEEALLKYIVKYFVIAP